MPIVLILLVIGGLLIVPTLNYASTSLKGHQVVETKTKGIYANDAGVEDALHQLKYTESGPDSSYNLGETVNTMQVSVNSTKGQHYVLYYGELIVESGKHNEYLLVNGDMEWDEGHGAYKYTITVIVTKKMPGAGEKIFLQEVGAKLPLGFTYESESASLFDDNLYHGPDSEHLPDTSTADGSQIVNWVFPTPRPYVRNNYAETRTQTFYIAGDGSEEGDYTWVVANRTDVGTVSEISGTLYIIEATAKLSGETTVIVTAEVLRHGEEGEPPYDIEIVSWQITK